MKMGQVWSKADFDGTEALGHHGGRGSVLAVTAQTSTVLTPLNKRPVDVSGDDPGQGDCNDSLDRVRGFLSLHVGGAFFLFGDGRVQFIGENINPETYRALSTIQGGEVVGGY